MTCASILIASVGLTVLSARPAFAQQSPPASPGPIPAPASAPAPVLMAYRAPVLAQVQPTGSGTVPLDKPVVVFRFVAGEPNDPLDARSFTISVDGQDRTAAFQQTAGEAWGPIADAADVAAGRFGAGAHRVAARICSSRGACATSEMQLLVLAPSLPASGVAAPAPATAKRRAIDLLLSATRRLIAP